ncbi:MAG: AraC family transcriptional regulator [Acutalibacteraceae bacterium]
MQHDEFMSLKETGQKGDFLLPYMVCTTILPDFYTSFPMHWHEEMELVYVEDGELDECIDLENYKVNKGDIILVNPCVLHSFKQHDESRAVLKTIIFNFNMLTSNTTDASSIKYFTPFLDGQYISPIVISPDAPHYNDLLAVVKNLVDIYTKKFDFFELRLKSELYNLFYVLFSYFFDLESHETSIKDNTTRNIKTILDYISENYMNPITIDELADSVNLSKHYFMRFFKKYMGMTCIEYINDYRLNVATNLLLTTNMQITEVSSSIGITNLSYFNRIFKKKYNMTPKEYRRNIDNQE